MATNSGRVLPTTSPKSVLAGFRYEFGDWISNDYGMMSLLKVATTSGGTKPIDWSCQMSFSLVEYNYMPNRF